MAYADATNGFAPCLASAPDGATLIFLSAQAALVDRKQDLDEPHFAPCGPWHLFALVFVPTLEAQDVGDDIQHVVFLDDDVGHGRMRGLHPYPERSSGDPWRVSDFPETWRLGIR